MKKKFLVTGADGFIGSHLNILNTWHPDEASYEINKNFEVSRRKRRGSKDVADSHTVLGMFSIQMIIQHYHAGGG